MTSFNSLTSIQKLSVLSLFLMRTTVAVYGLSVSANFQGIFSNGARVLPDFAMRTEVRHSKIFTSSIDSFS